MPGLGPGSLMPSITTIQRSFATSLGGRRRRQCNCSTTLTLSSKPFSPIKRRPRSGAISYAKLVIADPSQPPSSNSLKSSGLGYFRTRTLCLDGDDIEVRVPGAKAAYSASDMSDGERAIFYLVGQTLVANTNSVLVIDEPELHLHPSIMTALWDALATARSDCAFVFITHSLEFAASRPGAKFVLREFDPAPAWTLEPVLEHTGFSEETTTLLLGKRRPVLFVEGVDSSLDRLIFRSSFPDHFVLPQESCEAVIHAVASIRKNPALTRVMCHGIVDRDHRSPDEIQYLRSRGVEVLPVAEIENLVLLPAVSRAIATHEGYTGDDLEERLSCIHKAVFKLGYIRDSQRVE